MDIMSIAILVTVTGFGASIIVKLIMAAKEDKTRKLVSRPEGLQLHEEVPRFVRPADARQARNLARHLVDLLVPGETIIAACVGEITGKFSPNQPGAHLGDGSILVLTDGALYAVAKQYTITDTYRFEYRNIYGAGLIGLSLTMSLLGSAGEQLQFYTQDQQSRMKLYQELNSRSR